MHLGTLWLAVALAFAYALSVTAFLALQNRSPQSTFAWVLLFVLFPPGAWLAYIMFGRGRHVFSRELTAAKLLERSTLAERAARVVAAQPDAIADLADTQGEFARLAGMLWASGRSPLTVGNRLEILQNASSAHPPGTTTFADGVNVSLFSETATDVVLLLFDRASAIEPALVRGSSASR
jgi:cardiolipin synthase A/B